MPWIDNQYTFPRAAAANLQETWPWPTPAETPPPASPPINPLLRVKPLIEQPDDGGDLQDWTDPNYTAPRGDWAGELDVGGYGGRYPSSGTPYTKSWMPSILSTGGSLLGGSMGGLLGAGIGSAIDVYGADKLLGPYAYGYSPTGLSWGDAFVDATPLGWFGMGKSVEDQIADIFSYRGDDPHQLIQDPAYDAILGSLYEAPPWVDPDLDFGGGGGLDIGGEGVSYGGDDSGVSTYGGDVTADELSW